MCNCQFLICCRIRLICILFSLVYSFNNYYLIYYHLRFHLAMTDRTGILKNSPLTYVLASVRFAPWPLMVKKIDEIHDDLRDIVPLINRIQVQRIGVDGQASHDTETAPAAWMLMPSDHSFGIQFSPDQILCITKKYTSYTNFQDILDRVFDVLITHMRFLDITSMGIRYIDHIKAQKKESIAKYIDSGLLATDIGEYKKLGGTVTGTYLVDGGELRVRSICQPGMLSIAEDLIPLLAMTNEKNQPFQIELLKDNELLLDIDSLKRFEEATRLDKSEVLEQLKLLHQKANKFFRHESVCTEHAFKVWRGEA